MSPSTEEHFKLSVPASFLLPHLLGLVVRHNVRLVVDLLLDDLLYDVLQGDDADSLVVGIAVAFRVDLLDADCSTGGTRLTWRMTMWLLCQLSYAIKTHLKAQNTPYLGHFLPFAVYLWQRVPPMVCQCVLICLNMSTNQKSEHSISTNESAEVCLDDGHVALLA